MTGLEGLRVGNASAVSQEALIARLKQTAASGVFQWEGNRRARLVEDLDRLRRQLAARRGRIRLRPMFASASSRIFPPAFGCTVQLIPRGLDNAKSSPPHHRNRPRVSEPTG